MSSPPSYGPYGPSPWPTGRGLHPPGPQPYRPAAPPPPAPYGAMPAGVGGPVPPSAPRRRWAWAVAALAVATLVLGGVVTAQALGLGATEVVREPVATAGANPFMPGLGTDAIGVTPVAHASGTYSGSTVGLYGGTGDDATCDRAALGRFLDQHPDRAAGWSAVLGIRTDDVDRYLDGLTPVVLRSDTFVTNHGWTDGTVTSYPAVLQAGTAVLVDPYGNPVTRCSCGNPLSAPLAFDRVSYTGASWTSFSSTSVTVVSSSTTVVNDYSIVDVHTGAGHARPRGTDGEDDRAVTAVGSPLDSGGSDTPGATNAEGAPGEDGTEAGAAGLAAPEDTTTAPPTGTTTPSETSSSATVPSTTTTAVLAGSTWSAGGACASPLGGSTISMGPGSWTSGSSSGSWSESDGTVTLSGGGLATPLELLSGEGSMSGGGCTLTRGS